MAEKILVADDEERMRKLIRDFLSKEGYEILEAQDGEEALTLFYQKKDISLLILDVMMPKLNGYEVLQELREFSQLPVIMLTAKGAEEDELTGFRLGVDEYIIKPVRPRVLVARVKALLRRHQKEEEEILSCGNIVVDMALRRVTVDQKEVLLSGKEFALLSYFLRNQEIALSGERILNAVWDFDYYGDARTIDTHVKKLRSKLGASGNCIRTVWGMGYRMTNET